ncbi:MAG: hypothetical protein OXI88_19940 [Gammaproteobacteria bacterium]|nr:hypothetical protein [Gammaproteobacteria bacterium]
MMIAEIYEALVEAGTSEEKAKAAAGVVPVIGNLATKTDLQELRTEIKAELKLLNGAGIYVGWTFFTIWACWPVGVLSYLLNFLSISSEMYLDWAAN